MKLHSHFHHHFNTCNKSLPGFLFKIRLQQDVYKRQDYLEVGYGKGRGNHNSTENLVVYVPVQMFHQFLVILLGRYVLCQRTVHASLQAVLAHGLCVCVLIVFQLVPCHDVIGAQRCV